MAHGLHRDGHHLDGRLRMAAVKGRTRPLGRVDLNWRNLASTRLGFSNMVQTIIFL